MNKIISDWIGRYESLNRPYDPLNIVPDLTISPEVFDRGFAYHRERQASAGGALPIKGRHNEGLARKRPAPAEQAALKGTGKGTPAAIAQDLPAGVWGQSWPLPGESLPTAQQAAAGGLFQPVGAASSSQAAVAGGLFQPVGATAALQDTAGGLLQPVGAVVPAQAAAGGLLQPVGAAAGAQPVAGGLLQPVGAPDVQLGQDIPEPQRASLAVQSKAGGPSPSASAAAEVLRKRGKALPNQGPKVHPLPGGQRHRRRLPSRGHGPDNRSTFRYLNDGPMLAKTPRRA